MPARKTRRATRPEALVTYRKKRDFKATAEPEGAAIRPRAGSLRFVIQKHDASQLHFDLRLELDGVMKSWAVPKGPSNDPAVRRLAMQVEDHPVEYNTFEGTIPKGSYGGGTVMLWDVGTYQPLEGGVAELRAAWVAGSVKFVAHGERMKGEWALVRMKRGDGREWLLIKHRDKFARSGGNLTARTLTSITTGRTMEEIGGAKRSTAKKSTPKESNADAEPAGKPLEPMLARVGEVIPKGGDWAFEPKYDGIRVLAYADGDAVSLMTRNNRDKVAQFPEIAAAVAALSKKRRRPFVIDGEIVARRGKSHGRFQDLQERIHETSDDVIGRSAKSAPTTLLAFDILLDGVVPYVHEPWTTRRKTLEKLLSGTRAGALRLGKSQRGDGETLLATARADGWEGIMAKRTDSPYQPGVRSADWVKLKLEARQEFVVGGWTEPKRSREHLGAILLGHWKNGKLQYAGHTGGGFTRASLRAMYDRLALLEVDKSPFAVTPRTNAPAHWTRPITVVEVKFNEWTADGALRQPIFLGMRDDKAARLVVRERPSIQRGRRRVRPTATGAGA